MRMKLKLAVSNREFFGFLYESIINDVKTSTNKTINRGDVTKGYSYIKKSKKRGRKEEETKVSILEFIVNEKYTASFENDDGKNIISFQTESLEDDSTAVVYSEEYVPKSSKRGIKINLPKFLYRRKKRKNATAVLKNIENYIIKQRKKS